MTALNVLTASADSSCSSFDNVGTENDADEVFGAVVKNPSYDESEADRSSPDEFGLLSRLLYRNAEDGKG